MEITRRYRVSVSTSVKGVKTWDCTVEVNTDLNEMPEAKVREKILSESDALVAELDRRYPPVVESKEVK